MSRIHSLMKRNTLRGLRRRSLGLAGALGLSLLAAGTSFGQPAKPPLSSVGHLTQPLAPPMFDVAGDTWAGTYVDTRGQVQPLPDNAAVGGPRMNRTVGIFYFLSNNTPNFPLYDISQLLAANPANPAYGPVNLPHWWGQPVLGHYASADPAVLRKHMQMLSDAGVDVLIFDATNGLTYPDVYIPLFNVMRTMRGEGLKTPQIAFITGNNSWNTVYNDVYAKNLFPELWYRVNDDPNSSSPGKPLLLVHPNDGGRDPSTVLSAAEQAFFTSRYSWAWDPGQGRWDWTEFSNQQDPANGQRGSYDANGKLEEVSVSVASHPTNSIGHSYRGNVLGANRGSEPAVDQYHLTNTRGLGLYFDQQWQRALQLDPKFVFVTGWNEWTAQRFVVAPSSPGGVDSTHDFAGGTIGPGDTYFVDEFNAEFNRDIEPSTDALDGDNYYYKLVNYIRRYKGVRAVPPVTPATIPMNGDFRPWAAIQPEYRDTVGDPMHRSYPMWGRSYAYNQTGRNDIVSAKVTYDASTVYFSVHTKEPITPPSRDVRSWMMLFIDADHNPNTGWLGYDFVVNRTGIGAKTTIERNLGGYRWGNPTPITYQRFGRDLELAIPRSVLGVSSLPAILDFKWADNIAQDGTATDFTVNGDVAPNDRFNYRAKLGQ